MTLCFRPFEAAQARSGKKAPYGVAFAHEVIGNLGTNLAQLDLLGISGSQFETGAVGMHHFKPGGVSF